MIASAILAAALQGASVREVAARAGVPRRSVQGLLEGHVPSVDRAERICAALGLELYIGPPRTSGEPQLDAASAPTAGNIVPGTQIQRPLTTFSWRMELPVREWGHRSAEGHLSMAKEIARAPAPVDLVDNEAFYGQMTGQSMPREGIGGLGSYCLISPNTPLDVNEWVWLRHRGGQEVVRRLTGADAEAYSLEGWGPADERGHQDRIEERWKRPDVVAEGVVLAVYEGWPSVTSPPFRVPDVVGPEGQRVIRVPAADQRLATLLIALVRHYDRLSERGRDLFVAEMQGHFPVGRGAGSPSLPAGEEG